MRAAAEAWRGEVMKRAVVVGCASAILALGAAQAAEIAPMDAHSVRLGDVTGVAYYMITDDGYELVATVASEQGTPIRFVATLQDGQKTTLTVPRGVGESFLSIEFRRIDDRVFVNTGDKLSLKID
jgi:hypothetical protein